jgi:hypothetical protein
MQRYNLIRRLTSQSVEQFRELNIDEFDLNITEHIEEVEDIDSSVSPLIYAAYFGPPPLTQDSRTSRASS